MIATSSGRMRLGSAMGLGSGVAPCCSGSGAAPYAKSEPKPNSCMNTSSGRMSMGSAIGSAMGSAMGLGIGVGFGGTGIISGSGFGIGLSRGCMLCCFDVDFTTELFFNGFDS